MPAVIDVLNPFPEITAPQGRRGFLKTSLGAGFALAVQPVSAQTITTPADGLVAGEVKVPSLGVEIPAYRAMPATSGPFPTMLVIQEIFGVHEHIKDVCRRFAKLGYYAIAPDLYARQGDATKADIKTILSDIVPKVPDEQVMADLDASVAFARASGAADTARLGATGFCWGGRIIWLYAAHTKSVKAAVAFYGLLGGPASPTSALKPINPVDIGATITTPVLGLYGGKDDNIPNALIDMMRDELAKAKSPATIVVYPDTPHGFFADYRPSYRKPAAEDAWARLQAWFKDHGVS
jgi:carboxymethylenebutenolidase